VPIFENKVWIARVGLNMLGEAAAHWAKAVGSGPQCGMSHRIHEKRIPTRAFGEPKPKGSGTTCRRRLGCDSELLQHSRRLAVSTR